MSLPQKLRELYEKEEYFYTHAEYQKAYRVRKQITREIERNHFYLF